MKLGILIPFRANVYPEAVVSWFNMVGSLMRMPGVECRYYFVLQAHVHTARTALLRDALSNEVDWMLWLDDDAVPPPDIFSLLLAHADKADVIAPWFTAKNGDSVTYERGEDKGPNLPRIQGGRYVGGTGFHCVLMSPAAGREVTKLTDNTPFNAPMSDGSCTGEDVWFFMHLALTGMRVWQDCDIHVGHIGTKIV